MSIGQISEDGNYRWDGNDWVLLEQSTEQPATGSTTTGSSRLTSFCEKYPGATALVEGIDPSNPSIDTLIANFNKCDFQYTMAPVAPETFLGGAYSGDCSTLSKAFAMICTDGLGMTGVTTDQSGTDFFVSGGGEVVGGLTGNVDNGAHWAFTAHTWVVANGTEYDILFKGAAVDKGSWVYKTAEGTTEGGSGWRQFGETVVYAGDYTAPISGRYSTSAETAAEGLRRAEETITARRQLEEQERRQRVEAVVEEEEPPSDPAKDLREQFDAMIGNTTFAEAPSETEIEATVTKLWEFLGGGATIDMGNLFRAGKPAWITGNAFTPTVDEAAWREWLAS